MEEKKLQTSLEIVKKQPEEVVQVDNSPIGMLQMAITKGLDLDKVEKMIELQERWEKNEAKKAYMLAMSEFKKNAPEIEKDKKVGFETSKGKTSYSHATLANVCKKINSELSNHGLSAAWTTEQTDNKISVTCTITHKLGHSESTTLHSAPDTTGNKNSIQAIGSTITYLERYTLLAKTGLATHDQDDDGKNSGLVYINDAQKGHIVDMIAATSVGSVKFLKYLGVESIDEIPEGKYNAAISALKTRMDTIKAKERKKW